MTTNFKDLYKMQGDLDKTILKNYIKRNGQKMEEEELFEKTILAFVVELAEFSNKTRCFKFWSVKGMDKKEELLEEFADIMHFHLSIGNQLGFNADARFIDETLDIECDDKDCKKYDFCMKDRIGFQLTQVILKIIRNSMNLLTSNQGPKKNNPFNTLKQVDYYSSTHACLNAIKNLLDYSNEDIVNAYKSKNKINYERQENGY